MCHILQYLGMTNRLVPLLSKHLPFEHVLKLLQYCPELQHFHWCYFDHNDILDATFSTGFQIDITTNKNKNFTIKDATFFNILLREMRRIKQLHIIVLNPASVIDIMGLVSRVYSINVMFISELLDMHLLFQLCSRAKIASFRTVAHDLTTHEHSLITQLAEINLNFNLIQAPISNPLQFNGLSVTELDMFVRAPNIIATSLNSTRITLLFP